MKIRNVSGVDRIVPNLGRRMILADQIVEVPEDEVYNYTCQVHWDAVDKEAKTAHAAGEKAEAVRIKIERGEPVEEVTE